MYFVSTRDSKKAKYPAHDVIRRGIAPDGGLFFPESGVAFTSDELESIKKSPYAERAAKVLAKYLTDFTYDELLESCRAAYSAERFPKTPAPLHKVENDFYLELYHGPTCAFKDLALQLMPRLLSLSIEKSGVDGDALILVATSGDTGKAALEGFADVKRTKIIVFFPIDGVSEIQKKQMLTQKGGNVRVVGVKGNFDDCQTGVKTLFGDKEMIKKIGDRGCFFSSANSINFGRLVPQVAYYVSASLDMASETGKKCNITVPTGNFGNILAAYMAKKAGLPIGKLICASNMNNVLTDFFNTGVYDKRREFHLTSSPSMDILVSSNLERLIYLVCGAEKTASYMKDLKENGVFRLDDEDMAVIREDFAAYCADEDECAATIKRVYDEKGYLMDTHTAVAAFCAEKYKKDTLDDTPMMIVSTASPFKFSPAVCRALGTDAGSGFEAADKLSAFTSLEIPSPIAGIRYEEERFSSVISPDSLGSAVIDFA